eukprot:TRINITY_DN8579_c0_g1_i1.p1 TRINITY_DN8579_c0_g1~~TRINITY_DN8579_c0_g1_i1.p1  ORF type:complete len:103 (-),score=10.03 TRINITY_DN8579_c0_g1_i1:111-380(-)
MEAEFLSLLDYKVSIAASDYTKYFFELSDACVAQESLTRERKPLNRDAALKLEVQSASKEAEMIKERSLRRYQSSKDVKAEASSAPKQS